MFPDDEKAWTEDVIKKSFMFGPDFLVTPVMAEGATSVAVYFPKAEGESLSWINLWSGLE